MRSLPVAGKLTTLIVFLGSMLLSLVAATGAAADETVEDVENFHYTSWDVHYDLSLDDSGRAQADVVEELAAQFPEFDQNRGIIRSLPLRYQGAPAAPEDISVTDDSGNEVPFEIENADGFRNILVGDETFVHGAQTYVISYTVADVMHTTPQADEFYWDVVPVDRQQDINDVTATITLDDTLASSTTGDAACYRGTPDDTQACSIDGESFNDGVVQVAETDLPAGDGLTVAIGVEPGTVMQPPERQPSFVLDVLPLILVGVSIMLSAGGALSVWRMIRRHREDTSQTSIEYGVPAGMNPLLAKWVTGRGHDPITATLLDFAVRGVVRIEEAPQTNSRRTKKSKTKPMLRLVEPTLATDPLEVQLLEALFPGLTPGTLFTFPKQSKGFTKTAQQVLSESGQAVLDRGYQRKQRHRGAVLVGWLALTLLIPVLVLLILGASRGDTTTIISVVFGAFTLGLVLLCVLPHRVLTPKGAATRRQFERMRDVMESPKDQRLEMLQSFTSAPREYPAPDEPDASRILQIYDRLLPFAVLFGKQKDWTKALSTAYHHYQVAPPLWYPGLVAHGTEGMQSSLNTMLSTVSSAAATSSSGAGATGGGVAGGGGGGGAAGGR